MKRLCVLLIGAVVLGGGESAHAASFIALMQPSSLLNLTVLGLAVACALGSFRVLTLVRGGMLAKSWQLFMAAFVVLGASQLMALFHTMEFFSAPGFLVPMMYGCMAGLFLYGIFETRRTLS